MVLLSITWIDWFEHRMIHLESYLAVTPTQSVQLPVALGFPSSLLYLVLRYHNRLEVFFNDSPRGA